jgi:dihydrolipoamide dehydrogenase
VGLTEAKAKAAGREVKVGRKTGELLGAHMIGAEVTELIQGYATAMRAEVTEHELMETVFPHPTLSEMMHEAVLDAYGRVLHI